MEWIVTQGRTLKEAIDAALNVLGVTESDAEIEVVKEGRSGIMGIGRQGAQVRARVRPKRPPVKDDRRSGRRRGKPDSRRGNGRDNGRDNSRNSDRDDSRDNGREEKFDSREVKAEARTSSGGSRNGKSNSENSRSESRGDYVGSSRNGQSNNHANSQLNNQSSGQVNDQSSGQAIGQFNTQSSGRSNGNSNRKSRRHNGEGTGSTETRYEEHEMRAQLTLPEQAKIAVNFVDGLVKAFGAAAQCSARVKEADNQIEINVAGEDLGLLVGHQGVTLDAVQELTRSLVMQQCEESAHIHVDIAEYRAKRRDALQRFAQKVATQVKETGKEVYLEPMSPPDRKVVHDTINEIDGLSTRSEGHEPRRRVVVCPSVDTDGS